MNDDAFFIARGAGRYAATEYTRGPWSYQHQHAGPPAALLARAAEAELAEIPAMQVMRLTMEILRPVPIDTLTLKAETTHAGRRMRLIDLTLASADDRICMRARALAVRTEDLPVPEAVGAAEPLLSPERADAFEFPFFAEGNGYHRAMETRIARGEWGQGPVAAWLRMRVSLVAGETPSPLQRVMAAADSGNGLSVVLDLRRFTFVNPDLTVHLHRLPVGEWIGMDAITLPEGNGIGLADTRLHDARGPIGRGAQSLIIQAR